MNKATERETKPKTDRDETDKKNEAKNGQKL